MVSLEGYEKWMGYYCSVSVRPTTITHREHSASFKQGYQWTISYKPLVTKLSKVCRSLSSTRYVYLSLCVSFPIFYHSWFNINISINLSKILGGLRFFFNFWNSLASLQKMKTSSAWFVGFFYVAFFIHFVGLNIFK